MPDESFTDCLTLAKAELHRARTLLAQEIAAYPTPISGCDAQYNYLLQERRRIADALSSLDTPVFIATPRTPHPGAGIEIR